MSKSGRGSAPDEIREWISDHLLYIIIGAIALVILLVVIFSVRACKKGKTPTEDRTGTITTSTESNANVTTAGDETTQTIQHPLTQASSEIRTLIETYYQAVQNKDIETLRTVVMNLPAEEESRIANSNGYIEGYRVQDVYTKDGMSDGANVVYACVDYMFRDIETAYPALSQLYVVTADDGSLKIAGDSDVIGIGSAEYSSYMAQLESDSDFLQLKAQVQEANSKALASDSALQEFAAGLGESVTDTAGSTSAGTLAEGETTEPTETEPAPQGNGETRVTTDGVNVRSEPNSDWDNVISFAEEGTTVNLTGEEADGWYGVIVDGVEGYIYGDYLR